MTTVAEICRRIDSLPLAIELVAARARSMQLNRLLIALRKRFAVLKGGVVDLLVHQRYLRESIGWCYDLLDESEHCLWRRWQSLCGLHSRFRSRSVRPQCRLYRVDRYRFPARKKSGAKLPDALKRVTMLELRREFALIKLHESGEFEQIQARFIAWSVKQAPQVSFGRARTEIVISHLKQEQLNIRLTIHYSLDHKGWLRNELNLVRPTIAEDAHAHEAACRTGRTLTTDQMIDHVLKTG